MTSAPTSLVDRAGLDRPRLAKIISRGLEGADDGELFLEYRQAEDAGVRQRPAEAGDLRHLSGVRPARGQGRGGRLCARFGRVGGGHRARRRCRARGQGRLFRSLCRTAGAHQRQALRRRQPARQPGFRRQGAACWKPSTPTRAPRTRACARSRSASAPPGRRSRSCAATARPIATSARSCASMSRSWSATATGRRPAAPATAAAKATSASSSPIPGRTRSTTPCGRR